MDLPLMRDIARRMSRGRANKFYRYSGYSITELEDGDAFSSVLRILEVASSICGLISLSLR